MKQNLIFCLLQRLRGPTYFVIIKKSSLSTFDFFSTHCTTGLPSYTFPLVLGELCDELSISRRAESYRQIIEGFARLSDFGLDCIRLKEGPADENGARLAATFVLIVDCTRSFFEI